MTTVGYGDVYPVTGEGRLAAAVLMILGIGLYSIIIATVTSGLVNARADSPDVATTIRSLTALRDEGHIDDSTYLAKRDELLARL